MNPLCRERTWFLGIVQMDTVNSVVTKSSGIQKLLANGEVYLCSSTQFMERVDMFLKRIFDHHSMQTRIGVCTGITYRKV